MIKRPANEQAASAHGGPKRLLPERQALGAKIAVAIGGREKAAAFERESEGEFKRLTLQSWIDGRTAPTVEDLRRLADWTRRDLVFFIGDHLSSRPPPETRADVVRIAVVDARASAGPGAWNEHSQEIGGVSFPLDWLRRLGGPGVNADRCDFLRVAGDSMWPTIAGDALILINRADTTPPHAGAKKRALDDDIFVFIWKGDIKVKRLTRHAGEQLLLVSDNARLYPPEIAPAHAPLKVFGRVIWWDNRL